MSDDFQRESHWAVRCDIIDGKNIFLDVLYVRLLKRSIML